MNKSEFWKQKLMAFLHDPPCKCFDIPGHAERAKSFRKEAGIEDEDYKAFEHECDQAAAAADRFPFPKAAALKSQFSGGEDSPFRHPLGGEPLLLSKVMETATLAEESFQKSIGVVPRNIDDWKLKFFLYWRRWPEESAIHDKRLAFLPADTRMPDHTIWNHMSLTSALQACVTDGRLKPAFLIFQLGGVQDFIAQARSTRDLWSGSYLMSWLMAHAMKAIADLIGPDNIVFPSLRGQPIFDALYRKDVFEKIALNDGDTLWSRMYPQAETNAKSILTPSMPNRFLALVPAGREKGCAEATETALREELRRIGDKCWAWLAQKGADPEWKMRWDSQIELFPRITWSGLPWNSDFANLMRRYKNISFPDTDQPNTPPPHENLGDIIKLAEAGIPKGERDSRYFEDDKLKNPGNFWQAQYAFADFFMAARRNTRDFPFFETDEHQGGALKDARSGKEEVIGSEKFWDKLKSADPLKDENPLSAMNLIKRLWCRTEVGYLHDKLGITDAVFRKAVRYDSVPEVADRNILTLKDREAGHANSSNGYVAVIAMDGDQMGKWVAGVKTPPFFEQLSKEAQDYFGKLKDADHIRALRRPLSPSFHLQFSEALSNFTRLAAPVVEHFDGQLIYAGGDDVVAMVPATRALDCAYLLRCVFQGKEPAEISKESLAFTNGWIGLAKEMEFTKQAGWMTLKVYQPGGPKSVPLIVPGAKTDVSCGIAIAHQNHPLQAIVHEARNMEKHAKKHFGRAAVAVKLLKRGGEHTVWGAKWDGPALRLYHAFCRVAGYGDQPSQASSRFPYALAELLRPYQLHRRDEDMQPGFHCEEVILAEFEHVLKRQGEDMNEHEREALAEMASDYLAHLANAKSMNKQLREGRWDEFEKLFLTAAFIHRSRGDE